MRRLNNTHIQTTNHTHRRHNEKISHSTLRAGKTLIAVISFRCIVKVVTKVLTKTIRRLVEGLKRLFLCCVVHLFATQGRYLSFTTDILMFGLWSWNTVGGSAVIWNTGMYGLLNMYMTISLYQGGFLMTKVLIEQNRITSWYSLKLTTKISDNYRVIHAVFAKSCLYVNSHFSWTPMVEVYFPFHPGKSYYSKSATTSFETSTLNFTR